MTIILGDVCSNVCLGYMLGDNTPDYLALFGPAFGELTGHFELDIGASGYALTINGHTLSFPFNDPHLSISFDSPLLASFSSGAFLFTATGFNPFGIAIAEAEFLCLVPPGVPEPSTWAMLLFGFVVLWRRWRVRCAGGSGC